MARKRNVNRGRTRNKGKRGHIGQATQHALRTPEAKALALKQEDEIIANELRDVIEREQRKTAQEAKRLAMKKGK